MTDTASFKQFLFGYNILGLIRFWLRAREQITVEFDTDMFAETDFGNVLISDERSGLKARFSVPIWRTGVPVQEIKEKVIKSIKHLRPLEEVKKST